MYKLRITKYSEMYSASCSYDFNTELEARLKLARFLSDPSIKFNRVLYCSAQILKGEEIVYNFDSTFPKINLCATLCCPFYIEKKCDKFKNTYDCPVASLKEVVDRESYLEVYDYSLNTFFKDLVNFIITTLENPLDSSFEEDLEESIEFTLYTSGSKILVNRSDIVSHKVSKDNPNQVTIYLKNHYFLNVKDVSPEILQKLSWLES